LGLTLRSPKSLVERELHRLEFSDRDILPPSGDGAFDQRVAFYMGPKLQTRLEALIMSARYQAADRDTQAAMLRDAMDRIREEARERALRELRLRDPDRYERLYATHLPTAEREAIKREYGVVTPETAKRFRERYYRRP
jgi:hypothetical protein